MDKVCVEVEAGAWLAATGIETIVYIGDVDMPQVVKVESLESLIDQALESYEVEGKIPNIHKEEVEQLLAMLKSASEYAEKRCVWFV